VDRCTGDAHDAPDPVSVPHSLDEALNGFAESGIAEGTFGPSVVEHYVHAGEIELAVVEGQVTDVELRRGFDRA